MEMNNMIYVFYVIYKEKQLQIFVLIYYLQQKFDL